MIKSAASAASAKGGCASSRLDYGFKFYVIQGGCTSSRLIHPHQRCGYSDSPFARIYFFYTAGPRNELEEVDTVCPGKLTPRKRHFFLIEKYIEDARQDEKHVPDLLESIIQPPDPVKEEFLQKLLKITQFDSKINKMMVSTFWIPEIQSCPAGG